MFWDPLMRHLWKSKIWRCQWKLAVWLPILIAYRKRATHQSLARETGNMRHREKLRTVPDVSEQMLELFFAKIRHGELGRKSRRLRLGLTGRAPKIPPELGFTRFSLCWTAVYKQEQRTCWRAASHPRSATEFVPLVGAWLEAWLCETLPWVPWVFTENLEVHVPAFLWPPVQTSRGPWQTSAAWKVGLD